MKTVNAKGELCPVPLIMTKKALKEIDESESLKILLDNETSMTNVSRFLKDNGMEVNVIQDGNEYELQVVKKGNQFEESKVEEYCEVELPQKGGYVISFQKDKLGEGADELGEILIKGFINTLPDIDNLPETLIFLNSGVKLVSEGSHVIDALKKLDEKGIQILACGTCLDYFNLMDKLQVGTVSNMYEILDKLSQSTKVIYP